MPHHTPHQKKIIERYYDHRDEIMLGRLGEIVTELYLAGSTRQTDRLWKRAEKAMTALKVPKTMVSSILAGESPETLARHVRDWLSRAKQSNPKQHPQ